MRLCHLSPEGVLPKGAIGLETEHVYMPMSIHACILRMHAARRIIVWTCKMHRGSHGTLYHAIPCGRVFSIPELVWSDYF